MASFNVSSASAYLGLAASLAAKQINFTTDPIKCMLMQAYAPDTHSRYRSHVLAGGLSGGNEASGPGYSAGGATLTNIRWSLSNVATWVLTGNIPAWNTTGGTLSATHAVFYGATSADPAAQPLIAFWELNGGSLVTSSDGVFDLTVGIDGIIRFALA